MLREGGSYFGNDDLFFHLHNCLLDIIAAKRAFLLCRRRRGQFMGELNTCNVESRLATSFGRVADRESKHLS